jgi:hypothetical protein
MTHKYNNKANCNNKYQLSYKYEYYEYCSGTINNNCNVKYSQANYNYILINRP